MFKLFTNSFSAPGPTKRPSFGLKLPFWRPLPASTDPDGWYVEWNEFISWIHIMTDHWGHVSVLLYPIWCPRALKRPSFGLKVLSCIHVSFPVFMYPKYFPVFLDPKCYTWLESYRGEVSYCKMLKIFGVTIWPAEFFQHFGSEFITPAETLSYSEPSWSLLYLHSRIHCVHSHIACVNWFFVC